MTANVGQSVRLATEYTPWPVDLSPSSANSCRFPGTASYRILLLRLFFLPSATLSCEAISPSLKTDFPQKRKPDLTRFTWGRSPSFMFIILVLIRRVERMTANVGQSGLPLSTPLGQCIFPPTLPVLAGSSGKTIQDLRSASPEETEVQLEGQ